MATFKLFISCTLALHRLYMDHFSVINGGGHNPSESPPFVYLCMVHIWSVDGLCGAYVQTQSPHTWHLYVAKYINLVTRIIHDILYVTSYLSYYMCISVIQEGGGLG